MKALYQKVSNNVAFQFLYGAGGIYFFAFFGSVLHQKLLKVKYENFDNEAELFTYPVGLVIFPYLVGWLIGAAIKLAGKQQSMKIPTKNLFLCGLAVAVGTLTYNIAIMETSYPAVIMVKSCSILSVITVGVCCSRVRDQNNKLQKSKLIMGVFVAVGIFLFHKFSEKKDDEKTTTLFGGILLLISLLADGFLPDFQAQIKTVYKPQPVDLMSQINKWVFILSTVYSLISFEFLPIVTFMLSHPYFVWQMFLFSVSCTIVQLFVYYLIQKFRQHIVPFIITLRKILSVVLSIIWFHHDISGYQVIGIIVVLLAAVIDFFYNKYCHHHKPAESVSETSVVRDKDEVSLNSIAIEDSVEVETIDSVERGKREVTSDIESNTIQISTSRDETQENSKQGSSN